MSVSDFIVFEATKSRLERLPRIMWLTVLVLLRP